MVYTLSVTTTGREWCKIRQRYWRRIRKTISKLLEKFENMLSEKAIESEWYIYAEGLYYIKWKINKFRILKSLLFREILPRSERVWLFYVLDYLNFRAVWFADAIRVPKMVEDLAERYESDNNAKADLVVWLGNAWRRYLGE